MDREEVSEDIETRGSEDEEHVEEDGREEFTIIGEVRPTRLKPVKLSLPSWIQNATLFHHDISSPDHGVSELKPHIRDDTIQKLMDAGFSHLFPVQYSVIPYLKKSLETSFLMRPVDVCVAAPTGSGKTLAFVLPIIEYLRTKVQPAIRVLVVVPVGELAHQIKSVFDHYSRGTRLKTGCSIAQKSFTEDSESLVKKCVDGSYKSVVDIIVCTPGRLLDLMQRGPGFTLKHLELLVMDEADRMDNSEIDHNWIRHVERAVYSERQLVSCPCVSPHISNVSLESTCGCSASKYTLSKKPIQKWLFSATLTSDPIKLQDMNLFKPKLFKAADEDLRKTESKIVKTWAPTGLKEKMILVEEEDKPLVMWYFLKVLKYRRVLCFTGSTENSHRLCLLMKHIPNVSVDEISSNFHPKIREAVLKKFCSGITDVLISSDIMARGMDIQDVHYVICYDAPTTDITYIHRVGRTARAAKTGTAITLVTQDQLSRFSAVVRKAHRMSSESSTVYPLEKMDIEKKKLYNLKGEYKEALKSLAQSISIEKRHPRESSSSFSSRVNKRRCGEKSLKIV